MDRSQGIHRIGRPATLDLQPAHTRSPGSSSPTASRHIARRPLRAGVSLVTRLCGALCAGISTTRSKPELGPRVRASARCPGGVG